MLGQRMMDNLNLHTSKVYSPDGVSLQPVTQRPPLAGIILAAGLGTRMKSVLPKCAHLVCGLPMVEHIGRAMRAIGVDRPVVVIGHGGEVMRTLLSPDEYRFAEQKSQEGTGHAAKCGASALDGYEGPVLLAPGDTPLLNAEALAEIVDRHIATEAGVTFATFELADAGQYGRVIRNDDVFEKIVEYKNATAQERKCREVNSGVYCFDAAVLFDALPQLTKDNPQGEYLITDVLELAVKKGRHIEIVKFPDDSIFKGVNNRWELAEAQQMLQLQIVKQHAINGVTFDDPKTAYIGPDVVIEPDVLIRAMTIIEGATRIGKGSMIGPFTQIKESTIGEEVEIRQSTVCNADIRKGARCGPFCNIRPLSVIHEGARIGNFVEVKNSAVGEGAAANHLAYLGDAQIGPKTNIGAGTITCNYDGFEKHRTTIGADAFVGSNSTLVAPLTIGDGAIIAAGSTITSDVEADAMAFGRAQQMNKPERAREFRSKKREKLGNGNGGK